MSDSLSQPYTAPYFIKYNPALVAEFGSQNAVLLFDKLEYWFSKKADQFYKFIEPCAHPLCKKGDTWSEELGFSKKVFKTAFDKIGMRYISKTAFEKETDPFKGKLFAYYQDRQTKKTIFVRNNQLLKQLYEKLKVLIQEKIKPNQGGQGASAFKKGSPTERPLGSPRERATKDKHIVTPYIKNDNDFCENEINGFLTPHANDVSQTMLEIWTKELEGKGVPKVTKDVLEKLHQAFNGHFAQSIEKWREHCIKIASSKFLMGEKTNYEIRLLVAISEKFILDLSDGKYELGTRESQHHQEKKCLQEEAKQLALSLELIENHVKHLEDDQKALKKKRMFAQVNALSSAELERLKDLFAQDHASCSLFQKEGWSSKIIQMNFEVFLWKSVQDAIDMTDVETSFSKNIQALETKRGGVSEKYEALLKKIRSFRNMSSEVKSSPCFR